MTEKEIIEIMRNEFKELLIRHPELYETLKKCLSSQAPSKEGERRQ